MYQYIVIFWNEKEDREIHAEIRADNWFDADEIAKQYNLDGWIRGATFFADEQYVSLVPIDKVPSIATTGFWVSTTGI